ncbi:serine protease [Prevotella bivia DNF00320]|uniref:Serine protease n=1 Tax=Prevotella bivia DNF00320 TaxID=1401068 RepID=A0A096CIP2_9BACT|nr:patatin family protein [Prevotella bivia]KGF45189.1 serine protease [Prevotella bivia DNF00320]
MQINKNTGLVLEGGGMRGVFTSGVLDAFMMYGQWFQYIVAVSAGACNGLSYMSRQPCRARISNIEMLSKYNYIGLRHLITQGCIFDSKLLYEKFPLELIPFDYTEYFNNISRGCSFEFVTTNCLTGKAEYLEETEGNIQRVNKLAKASSSLPFVSKIVNIDGVPMLDGGIVDSIPIERAIDKGHETNVVVCTRNKGWRNSGRDIKIPPFLYRNYPNLRKVLSRRIAVYNAQLKLVDQLEAAGKIIVIRPEHPVEVSRMEKDTAKLEALYNEGFQLGEFFVKQNRIG